MKPLVVEAGDGMEVFGTGGCGDVEGQGVALVQVQGWTFGSWQPLTSWCSLEMAPVDQAGLVSAWLQFCCLERVAVCYAGKGSGVSNSL